MGREDHDRFDEQSARAVVQRRAVLDRGDLPRCGADYISRPEPDSAGHRAICNALRAGRRIEVCARHEIVIPHSRHFTEPSTITSINFAPGRANADFSVEATCPASVMRIASSPSAFASPQKSTGGSTKSMPTK